MSLEWLAATLTPGEVAPHPNFFSNEDLTPPRLFALLIQGRWRDYLNVIQGQRSSFDASQFDPTELAVVHAAANALHPDTLVTGAESLAEYAMAPRLVSACRTAAALLAAVAFCELDRHPEALEVVHGAIETLPKPVDADSRLLLASLLLQSAMRKAEVGQQGREEAERVQDLLRSRYLRQGDFSTFPLNKGTGWKSGRTLQRLAEELRATAEEHLVNLNPFEDNAWQRLVRSPAPRLRLEYSQRVASSYVAYTQELFRESVRSGTRTLFAEDPVETPSYEVYLHYELGGSVRESIKWRTQLAMFRLVRSATGDEEWERADAFRLFRHGDELKNLEALLRFTRANGPLSSIAEDARQIIQHRLAVDRLRPVELAVLASAGELLTEQEAGTALETVKSSIRAHVPAESRRAEVPSLRLEHAWRAALSLAEAASRLDETVLLLLRYVSSFANDDELLENAYLRTAANIDWDLVAAETAEHWREWLTETSSRLATLLVREIGPVLNIFPELADSEPTVADTAALLNFHFESGQPLPHEYAVAASRVVSNRLRSIQEEANRGQFAFTAVPAADVAAALALHGDRSELWTPLAELLADPRVARKDKAPALERLAAAEEVPSDFLSRLATATDEVMLSPEPDFFSDESSTAPFPAALLFFSAHGLLSGLEVLQGVTQLVASRYNSERARAGRILSLAARNDAEGTDWPIALTLQLSLDSHAGVRAEAGRGLVMFLGEGRYRGLVEARLLELLGDEGVSVPLVTLSALEEAEFDVRSSALGERCRDVAVAHIARTVRRQALRVVGDA